MKPDKLQKNAYIKRYNRTMRYDWLKQKLFTTFEQAKEQAEDWLYHYNHELRNDGFTPMQKLSQAA